MNKYLLQCKMGFDAMSYHFKTKADLVHECEEQIPGLMITQINEKEGTHPVQYQISGIYRIEVSAENLEEAKTLATIEWHDNNYSRTFWKYKGEFQTVYEQDEKAPKQFRKDKNHEIQI